jgi:hypothetical protein
VLPAALLHADSTASISSHESSSKADVSKAAIHDLFFCVSICNSLPVSMSSMSIYSPAESVFVFFYHQSK